MVVTPNGVTFLLSYGCNAAPLPSQNSPTDFPIVNHSLRDEMNLGKTMTTMRHAASQSQYQNGSSTRDKPVANRIEGRATVFSRLPGALARAALVVLLIAIPTAMLSTATADTGAFVSLVAIFAALFTLVEYTAASPSIVEFRSAPPFNRLRFGALFLTVVLLDAVDDAARH